MVILTNRGLRTRGIRKGGVKSVENLEVEKKGLTNEEECGIIYIVIDGTKEARTAAITRASSDVKAVSGFFV